MLRTIFVVGAMALLGLVALKLVFGLMGPLVALLFWLAGLALKVAVLGFVGYVVIRLVSPSTAQRLKDRWTTSSNSSSF
jgi:membrane protein implicated in regulation of membrane protease activity